MLCIAFIQKRLLFGTLLAVKWTAASNLLLALAVAASHSSRARRTRDKTMDETSIYRRRVSTDEVINSQLTLHCYDYTLVNIGLNLAGWDYNLNESLLCAWHIGIKVQNNSFGIIMNIASTRMRKRGSRELT